MKLDELMLLADAYGECLYLRQERHEARAALSAALTELVAERDEHKSNAMRNAAIAVTFKSERDALREALDKCVEAAKDAMKGTPT